MDALLQGIVKYGYWVVFGGVLAEQIGLPFPSQAILLAAGALVGSARLNLILVLAAATVASLIGDVLWYWIGRLGGARVLGWLCRISLERDSCVRKTERLITTQGARSLIFAKFVPGFSLVAPPLAGVARMPFLKFFTISAVGGVVWSGAFVAIGWIFSAQLEVAARWIAHFGKSAIALLVIVFLAYLATKYVARQRFLRKIKIARVSPEDLKSMIDRGDDVMIVDVRDQIDFDAEPSIIPGALHLSIEELEARHREIPREREIILYCT
jgi:membrane protein DedA with SNARE-associated domain